MVKADMVLWNGKIATVDKSFSFCEAVAVKDGWIIDTGSNDRIMEKVGPSTRVIDLGGKVLLPAAGDAHMHATLTGYTLGPRFINVGFPEVKSVSELQAKISKAAERLKPGEWIYGSGFMDFMIEECAAEGRCLTRHDLDPASPDNPVILNDFGLHTMLVNSKALELAGISMDYPELPPEEGVLERDPVTGEPNGRLLEWSAHHLIGKHCPVVSEEEIEACILRVQKALNREGVTSHTDIVGRGVENIFLGVSRERAIHVYERMHEEGKLTARISLSINPCINGVESYDSVMAALDEMTLPDFRDKNWVKADTIKLFGDQGAWLRARDDRPDGAGRSVFPGESDGEQAEEIMRTIVELHRRGWQVCIHAIGGKTIDVAIDAFIKAQELYPRKASRHYLIHADDMVVENTIKMSKHRIGSSPQPIAAYTVAEFRVPVMTAGDELFDWQAHMDAGVTVAAGSDSPCFTSNWRLGVQFAITRIAMTGRQVRPDLGMKLEDAIRMYTIECAKQESLEDVRGSVEVNKVADFQVLGRDIFTCPKEEIGQIPVVMTICAGKIVFDAGEEG